MINEFRWRLGDQCFEPDKKVRAQGQKLTIRLVDESGVNDSLVPDVIRQTFRLSRVVL